MVAAASEFFACVREDSAAANCALAEAIWVLVELADEVTCSLAASTPACAVSTADCRSVVPSRARTAPLDTFCPTATLTAVTVPETENARSDSVVGLIVPEVDTVCCSVVLLAATTEVVAAVVVAAEELRLLHQ